MEAIAQSEIAEIAYVADTNGDAAREAADRVPGARVVSGLAEMLASGVDGVVIATPSSLHAEQSEEALAAGAAVFCQKPLGRSGDETQRVVEAARRADRLLGVDFSYRHTRGMQQVRELVRDGALGRVFAAELVFHNAYGPDKPWFYDPKLSGGGCVMDLGIHLVDLALWALGWPAVERIESRVFAKGRPVTELESTVEDFATARVDLASGTSMRLACSWRLHAGCDAVIEASFFGTDGGATMRNVNGSFYDFRTELHRGTSREVLCDSPEPWGGRAAVDWAARLARGERFDPEIGRVVEVARTLDEIRQGGLRRV
jgi:predicted dehydrogenase